MLVARCLMSQYRRSGPDAIEVWLRSGRFNLADDLRGLDEHRIADRQIFHHLGSAQPAGYPTIRTHASRRRLAWSSKRYEPASASDPETTPVSKASAKGKP
jgi:hypothetical protein